jgi:coatomer protein complex subunit gamma
MASKKYDSDKNDHPYGSIEKAQVLQEARVFNEYPVNAKKCRIVLTKILILLSNSPFQRAEATTLFFSITRLFQCPDTSLRQIVYLVVKELATQADDVMMITSSVTKDMNSKTDLVYRPNSIRALAKITDVSCFIIVEIILTLNFRHPNCHYWAYD